MHDGHLSRGTLSILAPSQEQAPLPAIIMLLGKMMLRRTTLGHLAPSEDETQVISKMFLVPKRGIASTVPVRVVEVVVRLGGLRTQKRRTTNGGLMAGGRGVMVGSANNVAQMRCLAALSL